MMEDDVLVIPYLMSPSGNPMTLGKAALPRLRCIWARLDRRLRAEWASRRVQQQPLQPVWEFAHAYRIAAEGRAAEADAADLAELDFHIAFACLLML
jgi:hypothetical protein